MSEMTEQKIGFIGLGRMASAIIKGIIGSGFIKKENIIGFDVNEEARKLAESNFGIKTLSSIDELLDQTQILFLATKPFVVNDVLEQIKGKADNRLIISILAGVALKKYEEILSAARVVRVMPNTPALIGCGMSAVCKGTKATEEDCEFVYNLVSNFGKAIKIDEKYIDIVTAISGSGPAFYYYIIEKMAQAGVKLGLDYKTCLTLSAQTAIGSARMMFETGNTTEELIRAVTTPGGCTEVGNNVLNESEIDEILFDCIEKTMKKAESLGK